MSMCRRLHHDEKGQTATELALVLPVFCVLLFAVIQFGILFNNYVTLTDAVRSGARKAVVSRTAADPVGVATAAVRNAAGGLDTDPAKLPITVTATAWQHAGDVTVSAKYRYEINLLGWVAASGWLESHTTERIE